jgi:hypothetical protein
MHCSLFIPDFFSTESASIGDRLAAAETLIARGRRKRGPPVSQEAWLFARFGVQRQGDWPVAPYTLLADGGAPEHHFWMRADPVHLSVGSGNLGLARPTLDVSRSEAEALVETLNHHFGEAAVFSWLQPERWYVRLERAPALRTTSPYAARGRTIGHELPSGADAMRFHSMMNEAQMLLHEHRVNSEREARGASAVNSVWLWGGGVLEAPRVRPYSIVLAEGALARGLALAAGLPQRRLPANAATTLPGLPEDGTILIVFDSPRHAALERDWFEPLRAALEDGRIGMLSLYLAGGNSMLEVETVRSDLRYFWRTRKRLETYLA